jgi:hypothetical protein
LVTVILSRPEILGFPFQDLDLLFRLLQPLGHAPVDVFALGFMLLARIAAPFFPVPA